MLALVDAQEEVVEELVGRLTLVCPGRGSARSKVVPDALLFLYTERIGKVIVGKLPDIEHPKVSDLEAVALGRIAKDEVFCFKEFFD